MMICEREVPGIGDGRSRVDVNSLGFGGTLFVKTVEALESIKMIGPLNVLRQVAKRV